MYCFWRHGCLLLLFLLFASIHGLGRTNKRRPDRRLMKTFSKRLRDGTCRPATPVTFGPLRAEWLWFTTGVHKRRYWVQLRQASARPSVFVCALYLASSPSPSSHQPVMTAVGLYARSMYRQISSLITILLVRLSSDQNEFVGNKHFLTFHDPGSHQSLIDSLTDPLVLYTFRHRVLCGSYANRERLFRRPLLDRSSFSSLIFKRNC